MRVEPAAEAGVGGAFADQDAGAAEAVEALHRGARLAGEDAADGFAEVGVALELGEQAPQLV